MSEKISKSKSSEAQSFSEQDKDQIRLNVFLQEHGVSSRRKADALIVSGKVKVNGKVITQLGSKVAKEAVVSIDGLLLKGQVPKMTFLLHKPDLFITSRKSEDSRQTIFHLPALAKLPQNVQAVGRLDYRSEGLIVLTNDGDLAFTLTHPKFHVEKTYHVLLSAALTREEIGQLKKGVELQDGLARASVIRKLGKVNLGSDKRGQWIEIVIQEGRNRLIRRMFEHLGIKVIRLVRIAIGEMMLPEDLGPGAIRAVEGEMLKYLQKVKAQGEKLRSQNTAGSKTHKDVKVQRYKPTLNDAEYALEKERRSMQAKAKRRQREQKQIQENKPQNISRSGKV